MTPPGIGLGTFGLVQFLAVQLARGREAHYLQGHVIL